MNRLTEIEKAICELSVDELSKLRQWFAERDEENLDRDFEQDVRARRLDALQNESWPHLGFGREAEHASV